MSVKSQLLHAISRLQDYLRENPTMLGLLGGLITPLIVLVLTLRCWRIAARGDFSPLWALPDLFRSDFFALAAFALLAWFSLNAVSRSRIASILVLLGFQAITLIWAISEIVAHYYFLLTHSTFDLHLLFYAIENSAEIFRLITSVVTINAGAIVGGVAAICLVLPWGLRAWALSSPGESLAPISTSRHSPRAAGLIVLACIVFSFMPPIAEDHITFARANMVNMVTSLRDVRMTEEMVSSVHREPLHELEILPSGTHDGAHPNLAIIILESVRPDWMTLYNRELETTPFLAELSEQSLVADRAYSLSLHTSKALVSILCGFEPNLRMPITEAEPQGIQGRCFPDLLRELGYNSLFLQSATETFENRRNLIKNIGFDKFLSLEDMDTTGYERANWLGFEDMLMLPYSRQWLEANRDEPFLISFLTITTHQEYLAPRRFGHVDFHPDEEFNRYLNTVYYSDQFVREILEQFKSLGLYENTIFLIIGDHGEGFEEGRLFHGENIWETGIRIPFLLHDPREPAHRRVEAPVSQLDVIPTLLQYMNLTAQNGEYPGIAVTDIPPDRAVFSHCWRPRQCLARIDGRWKYIDHFGGRPAEIYDLHADPDERENLFHLYPEQAKSWRAEVYGWRESILKLYPQ